MKIIRLQILNSPIYNPNSILIMNKEIADHFEMMCKIMNLYPNVIIVEIEQ